MQSNPVFSPISVYRSVRRARPWSSPFRRRRFGHLMPRSQTRESLDFGPKPHGFDYGLMAASKLGPYETKPIGATRTPPVVRAMRASASDAPSRSHCMDPAERGVLQPPQRPWRTPAPPPQSVAPACRSSSMTGACNCSDGIRVSRSRIEVQTSSDLIFSSTTTVSMMCKAS
jgi:hypothetical protein